jgi:hypothetical protein
MRAKTLTEKTTNEPTPRGTLRAVRSPASLLARLGASRVRLGRPVGYNS